MRMHHTRYHWIMVALAVLAFLLAVSDAHGQSAGAAATFEGRPALAGAQAGQGAQAGPPQGGIGVQGSQAAERGVRLRKPAGPDENMPQGKRDENLDASAPAASGIAARKEVAPARDRGLAKDEGSSARKAKRAAKRTITRARHGVSEVDSESAKSPR